MAGRERKREEGEESKVRRRRIGENVGEEEGGKGM